MPCYSVTICCCQCGSAEWLACAPGCEAEARVQANLYLLHPAPEVPLVAWCAAHWPALARTQAG